MFSEPGAQPCGHGQAVTGTWGCRAVTRFGGGRVLCRGLRGSQVCPQTPRVTGVGALTPLHEVILAQEAKMLGGPFSFMHRAAHAPVNSLGMF